jgi:26S proteasome regulatory subunit N11
MEQMQRMMQQRAGGGQGAQPGDMPQVDTAEQVYISSLALLKMLKHGQCLDCG